MEIYKSLPDKQADAVLAELEKIKLPGYFRAEIYQNGREVGWYVWGLNGGAVTFSENRNSDQIVLYPGNFGAALFERGPAPDKLYAAKEFFNPGDYTKVAKRAAAIIRAQIKAEKSKKKGSPCPAAK